jgi:hypothetical protein
MHGRGPCVRHVCLQIRTVMYEREEIVRTVVTVYVALE